MEKSSFINKLSILRKKNIALIGHMGSGKSVLGKKHKHCSNSNLIYIWCPHKQAIKDRIWKNYIFYRYE